MEYQCDGFLEKNRDTVYEEQINILKASQVGTRILLKVLLEFLLEVRLEVLLEVLLEGAPWLTGADLLWSQMLES